MIQTFFFTILSLFNLLYVKQLLFYNCAFEVKLKLLPASFCFYTGFLNIWDLRTGKHPIHRFEHEARIQALALSRQGATVATASASDAVLLRPNEGGCWQAAAEFEVQKLVSFSSGHFTCHS